MITNIIKYEKGIGNCTKCICDYCGNEFWRRTSEINNLLNKRNISTQFCSRNCVCSNRNSKSKGKIKINQYIPSKKLDELSPFRYFKQVILISFKNIN